MDMDQKMDHEHRLCMMAAIIYAGGNHSEDDAIARALHIDDQMLKTLASRKA